MAIPLAETRPLPPFPWLLLGLETSCDESSASVVRWEGPGFCPQVLSLATFSQIAVHAPYGGVVPEIASRHHLETLPCMIQQALKEANLPQEALHAVAVTHRPGLIGALLVGVCTAKSLAYALQIPLVPVHHLEGHLASLFLTPEAGKPLLSTPFPMLFGLISGGHTQLYRLSSSPEHWPIDFLGTHLLCRSRDDAAGEAFDKIGKLLGLPYPGGKWVDQMSSGGNPRAFSLPRPLSQDASTLDFSFSGLKTAVALLVQAFPNSETLKAALPDLCASAQQAILDTLLSKIKLALQQETFHSLAIAGGVSANRSLRNSLRPEAFPMSSLQACFFPPLEYSTDNAAMIAAAGAFRLAQGHFLKVPDLFNLTASSH